MIRMRKAILAIPSRCAVQFADPRHVEQVIRRECELALKQIAGKATWKTIRLLGTGRFFPRPLRFQVGLRLLFNRGGFPRWSLFRLLPIADNADW
jgi:hypothetical protein